jgi:hypothetical protein
VGFWRVLGVVLAGALCLMVVSVPLSVLASVLPGRAGYLVQLVLGTLSGALIAVFTTVMYLLARGERDLVYAPLRLTLL